MKGHEVFIEHLKPLLKYQSEGSIREGDIGQINEILNGIPFFSSLIYQAKILSFERVTINKRIFKGEQKRIEEVCFLGNPPEELVSNYSRINSPHQSVLYAGFDHITILSELRPEVGDLITVSRWELITDHDLVISPVFKKTTQDGIVHNELSIRAIIEYNRLLRRQDEDTAKQIDILIGFMADFFSKKVDDNNHLDYYIGAYFANKILTDFANGEVEAIIYPSVRQSLTLSNIGVKADVFKNNYAIAEVSESIVTGVPIGHDGGWSLSGTGNSKSFDNGKIIWK